MAEAREPLPHEAVIFTYHSTDPGNPKPWAASLDHSGPGRHWLAFGATEDAARKSLLTFLTPKPVAGKKPKAADTEGAADAAEDALEDGVEEMLADMRADALEDEPDEAI